MGLYVGARAGPVKERASNACEQAPQQVEVHAARAARVTGEHGERLPGLAQVIDLGPEGGDRGGRIVAQGTPEEIAARHRSHTGRILAQFLRSHAPQ
jgi:hypothetical protein